MRHFNKKPIVILISILGFLLLFNWRYVPHLEYDNEYTQKESIPTAVKSIHSVHAINEINSTYTEPKHDVQKILVTSVSRNKESNVPYPPVEARNIITKDTGGFHVILTFRVMNNGERGDARMKEYLYSLDKMLKNDLVKYVFLLADSVEMSVYIKNNFGYHPKLLVQITEKTDTALTLHQFAFSHLQGELVVITTADTLLGEGFEKVNRTLLTEKKIMYSLSRHESECGTRPDECENYRGSHDTFVFVPLGNLKTVARDLLNHQIYTMGTENVVMFVYKDLLGYTVLNPCRILNIYHYHCTNLRKYKQKQRMIVRPHLRIPPEDRLM